MSKIIEFVHEFRGNYPVISTEVDIAGLTEGDEHPFFVTLPIGKVGTKSRNNRTYSREAVEAIVAQINQKRPGGNLGHLRDEDRPYKFDLPVLMWVGATLDDDGTAWGKAYVPPYADNVRKYLKGQMKLNARVATSIFGMADIATDGTVNGDLQIESIDLADPERAAVPEAVSVPMITNEMRAEEMPTETQYAELISERDGLKSQVETLKTELETLRANEASAKTAVSEMQSTIVSLVGENWQETIQTLQAERTALTEQIAGMTDLKAQYDAMVAENAALLTDGIESLLATVQIEKARPMIRRLVLAENASTRQALQDAFNRVMELEEVKVMLQAMVVETMGEPLHLVGSGPSDKKMKHVRIEGE